MLCCFKYKINVLDYNYINPQDTQIKNLDIFKLKEQYIKKYYNICLKNNIFKKICENQEYFYSYEIFDLVSKYKLEEIKGNNKFNISINPIGKGNNKNNKKIISELFLTYSSIFKLMFKNNNKYFIDFLNEIIYNCEKTFQEEWIIFNMFVVIKYLIK